LSAFGGLVRLWRACPPLEGLSAFGGLVRLWRACPPLADPLDSNYIKSATNERIFFIYKKKQMSIVMEDML